MTHALQPEDFREKRAEPRTSVRRVIDVLPCCAGGGSDFVGCELLDCSLHGLGLISQIPMARDQQFLVKLQIHGKIKLLLYTVHNCSAWDKKGFRIGAKFSGFAATAIDETAETILQTLIAEDADGSKPGIGESTARIGR